MARPLARPTAAAGIADLLATWLARLRVNVGRPRLLRWLMVGSLAVITAMIATRLTAEAEEVLAGYGTTRTVVVAGVDLPPGTVVGPSDIRLEARPVALLPDGTLDELAAGAVTRTFIAAGEPVLAARVAPLGSSPLAAGLGPGTRALAIPRRDDIPPLELGDHVDVIFAADPAFPTDTVTLSSGAEVRAVTEVAVVVAVPEADAPSVAGAAQTGGVGLILRPT